MRYLIVDLEATCWQNEKDNSKMETIEIGALMLPESLELPAPEYQRFIRPFAHPILTEFCTQLTSITQETVDSADYFQTVFPDFVAWIEEQTRDEPFTFCSWGDYDYGQLKRDCARWGLDFPASFDQRINLKRAYKQVFKVRVGMADALGMLDMTLEGTHHRGIDDARNIARIAQVVLPRLK